MIIACPASQTRYAVPDSAIGMEGRTVRCAKCKHSWFQDGAEEAAAAQGLGNGDPVAAASPARTATPAPAPAASAPPPPASRGVRSAMPAEDATPPVPPPAAAEAASATPAWPAENPPSAPPPAPDFDEAEPPSYTRPTRQPLPPVADGGEDGVSHFDHAPPFRPRRHFGRMWTLAALIFAALALGTVATMQFAGAPSWWPFKTSAWGRAQPDLKLSFPAEQQSSRELSNGTRLFSARIIIENTSRETRDLPPVLIVMLDERERQVFSWVVQPPKPDIAPGETVTIDEARTDVPENAVYADVGWAPV